MADQQKLKEILRPVMESIVPAKNLRTLANAKTAIRLDGTIDPAALVSSLPGLWTSWFLSGVVSIGTNKEREIEAPTDIVITGVRVRAKTAPTTAELTVNVLGNGAIIATASVSIGQSSGRTVGLNVLVAAGTSLTIDTTSVGASANVTVLLSYTASST